MISYGAFSRHTHEQLLDILTSFSQITSSELFEIYYLIIFLINHNYSNTFFKIILGI